MNPAEGPPGRLGELSFLIGGSWVTRSGTSMWEESFSWGAGQQSIETIVIQRSQGTLVSTGRGRFVWDAASERIMTASFIDGTYFASCEIPPIRPGRWRFSCIVVGQTGTSTQATMIQIDENTFEMSSEGQPPRVYHRSGLEATP